MLFQYFKRYTPILQVFALIFMLAMPAKAADVEGLWLTENERSVIEIEECDKGLCGYIYWIIEGGMQFDEKNPNEALRTQPMCDLAILWGFEKDGNGNWSNGKIYKADDGDIYNAELELQDNGKLEVRGYVGIPLFGKTQTWTKVNPANYDRCSSGS